MNITIKTIQHNRQRYDTCGDWWFDKKGNLQVRVSDMNNWKYEYLVADHEVREALLCKDRGVTQKEVDEFDMGWQRHNGLLEPGMALIERNDDGNFRLHFILSRGLRFPRPPPIPRRRAASPRR